MRMRMRMAAWFAVALVGCSTAEGARESDDVFEYEPGLFIPLRSDGKADLANGWFDAKVLDTSAYLTIANLFVAAHHDVKRTQAVAAFDWPLEASRAVLNRCGTPIRLVSYVFEHTGLDVIRLSDAEDATVHAPVAGKALVTGWNGDPKNPSYHYSTVISIWDPETHLIVEVMHVKPDP